VWQRVWDEHDRSFRMLAVAQDAHGAQRVAPVVEAAGVTFPVLLDPSSSLGRELGLRIVPAGCFVAADGTLVLRHADDFDVADPRVRANLEAFLEGRPVEPPEDGEAMEPGALERFAQGVSAYAAGRRDEAITQWRAALELDPDNFLIRSQIWTAEHPERFWPVVDRDWQELQLLREGYDKPLP
jgi:hypothetical protein